MTTSHDSAHLHHLQVILELDKVSRRPVTRRVRMTYPLLYDSCVFCGGVTRRKQHQPGITPNDTTTHVPTAGSSAALTKLLRWCIALAFGLVSLGLHFFLHADLCWVGCCCDSWVLLSLICVLRVTHPISICKYTHMYLGF